MAAVEGSYSLGVLSITSLTMVHIKNFDYLSDCCSPSLELSELQHSVEVIYLPAVPLALCEQLS